MIKLMKTINTYKTTTFEQRYSSNLISPIALYKVLQNRAWINYHKAGRKDK